MVSVKSGAKAKSGKPKAGPVDDAAAIVMANPEQTAKIFSFLFGLIKSLLTKKPTPVLPPVVVKPVPNPNAIDDEFPDDVIPAPRPNQGRTVTKVECKLARVELNKHRFPDAPDGGLLPPEVRKDITDGKTAMNYASKFWIDLTAYDQHGKEFLRGDVLAYNLQYRTEHHAEDAFIRGNGGPALDPAQYEAVDTDVVGNGISAWISSMGFLHQFKAHGEGQYEIWGKVNGVESNRFTIKVS